MAYRLPSERIRLPITDGPTIEVERCGSYPIAQQALRLIAACVAAEPGPPTDAALRVTYECFVVEALPTWEILDHRGVILPTVGGMLRLDPDLALTFVQGWCETLPGPESELETAADKVLPPGALRDQVNAGLRKKKG